VTERIKRGFT